MNEESFGLLAALSALVVFVLVMVSLVVFWRRIKSLGDEVTAATRRALAFYAAAGFAIAATLLVGVVSNIRDLTPVAGGFSLVCLVTSEMWILLSERSARHGSIFMLIVTGVLVIEAAFALVGGPVSFSYVIFSGLAITSLAMSLTIVRNTPSAFSFSLLAVLLSFLLSMGLAVTGLSQIPEFFIVQDTPVLLVAAVFSSFRQPRRTMLTVFLYTLLLATIVPVLLVSLMVPTAGDTSIWTVVLMEAFACFALMTSLGYFAKQASDTGSRTPAYLGAASAIIALTVSVHVVMWAVYVSSRTYPSLAFSLEYLQWFVIAGCASAVGCFLLAYVTTALPEWMYPPLREAVVCFMVTVGLLACPLVQLITVTSEGKIALLRWVVVGPDFFVTFLLLIVAYRFHRKGATKAAQRLALFQVSALLMILIAAWTGPLLTDAAMTLAFFICGLFALAGSPWFALRVGRTIRKLDQLSELGVAEDGAIRW